MIKMKISKNEVPISVATLIKREKLKDVCVVMSEGNRLTLETLINKECEVLFFSYDDEIGKNAYLEETAAILSLVVKKLYGSAKLAGFGHKKNQFFYDFDIEKPFTSIEIAQIEKQMYKLIKGGIKFNLLENETSKLLTNADECYLSELKKRNKESYLYECEGVYMLTENPLIISISKIGNFKLTSSSAAYWDSNENNKMLQRVTGVSFDKVDKLKEYIKLQQELEKRNNKKIGKELDLFIFDDTAPGMPYWLPKGQKMFNILVDFWRKEHEARGYNEFSAPLLNDSSLWKTSGHWNHYRKDMFVFTDENGEEKALKPMSCPNAIKIYQSKLRSYKDLPLRFNDIDVIHRNEKSGELNGMLRVRMFRQDDSHNFIREDQISEEISEILDIANKFYGVFGLEYKVSLSTRPDNFMGDISIWNNAENALRNVLDNIFGKENYNIKEGDGAFYGPKIDIQMEDSLGREWQMGTIQLDFQLPKRFNITYVDENGKQKTPIILHRVIYGSLERFIGIITEHFNGAFPLWFAPVQVAVAIIGSENQKDYAESVSKYLIENNIRIEKLFKNDSISKKIKYSQMQKIPYTVIVGDNEIATNTISVRSRKNGVIGNMTIEDFVNKVNKEVVGFSMDN